MSNPKEIPQTEESKIVFQESFITIQHDSLRLPKGQLYSYYTLVTKPFAVAILATSEDGRYIINEEYRHPTKHFLLSCPGGFMDEGESPLEAARRELEEETGYQAKSLELMGSAYPYAGFSTQKTFFVRAIEAKLVSHPHLEPMEIIKTSLKTKDEIYHAIQQGAELDGPLCTAFFFESFPYRI